MSRFLGALLALSAIATPFSLPASAAARVGDPSQLIQSVAADITHDVKTRSGAERETAMRQVLQRDFGLAYIASAALGRHWNEASAPQKARILAALETNEARAYADRLGGFSSLTVSGVTEKSPEMWLVDSRLNLADGKSIKVEWEVRRLDRELRICDVKVSGVSLFQTERAGFQSYIQSHGGTVEPLVQVLEARAAR